jgi:hypothetical protein
MAFRNISSVRRTIPSELITPTQIARAEAAARQILKLVEKARHPGKTVRVYAKTLRGGDVIVRRGRELKVLSRRVRRSTTEVDVQCIDLNTDELTCLTYHSRTVTAFIYPRR